MLSLPPLIETKYHTVRKYSFFIANIGGFVFT